MATGRGWGGAFPTGSNHPALARASAAPPYPRRGILSPTYVAVFSFHWSPQCLYANSREVIKPQSKSSSA
jgi:hypothetical protein